MNKEINIIPPEGFEVDKENSTFECIKFKPIKNKLPKTWEEFCKNNNVKKEEFFIDNISRVKEVCAGHIIIRDTKMDRNLLTSKELAEAMLTICQLIQLRDCYNDGWKPDWKNNHEIKYCIITISGEIITTCYSGTQRVLTFKTAELCDQFLKNFRDLIEIAKPLL